MGNEQINGVGVPEYLTKSHSKLILQCHTMYGKSNDVLN